MLTTLQSETCKPEQTSSVLQHPLPLSTGQLPTDTGKEGGTTTYSSLFLQPQQPLACSQCTDATLAGLSALECSFPYCPQLPLPVFIKQHCHAKTSFTTRTSHSLTSLFFHLNYCFLINYLTQSLNFGRGEYSPLLAHTCSLSLIQNIGDQRDY